VIEVTHASPDPLEVDGDDVEVIQNDETLTAADRVDMIANQIVAREENDESQNRD
jgi:hypothetical protein